MEAKVKQGNERYCPFCNYKMQMQTDVQRYRHALQRYYYVCPSCNARTPIGHSEKQAGELASKASAEAPRIIRASAAERAFEETNIAVWYEEFFAGLRNLQPAIITKESGLLTEDVFIDASELDWNNYRKTWRLWTRKPTEQQRMVVPLNG